MTLEPEKYRHHFDELGLTDEQTMAMCEAICAIADVFADRAFSPPAAPQHMAANDNNSVGKTNVINLFQQSAKFEEPSASTEKRCREHR